MDDFDERVRQRAHRLWVEEGCPEGRSEVHWEKARELVAIEENQKLATKPVPRGDNAAGEPVEPIEALSNAGEFPTLTDQGEQSPPKRRRAAPSRAPVRRRPAAAPKQRKATGAKRR
jgi:hypothetical protein